MAPIMTTWTVIVLTLEGPLISVLDPSAIAATVLSRIPAAKPRVILDLRAVPSVDASGVGLIAALCGAARDRGGDLRLVGLHDRPRRLLETSALLRLLQTFETEEGALESIVRGGDPELYLERAPVGLREPWWRTHEAFGDVTSQCLGRMAI